MGEKGEYLNVLEKMMISAEATLNFTGTNHLTCLGLLPPEKNHMQGIIPQYCKEYRRTSKGESDANMVCRKSPFSLL